jgi:hypothetical protein
VGFTKWAAKLMGEILVFTPKRLGFDFEPNRSFGVLEGGKWAGSAPAAFDGVVVSHNERQLVPESGAPINSIANGRVLLGTCLFGVLLCERNLKNGPPRLKPRWWAENFTDSKLCDQPLVPHG